MRRGRWLTGLVVALVALGLFPAAAQAEEASPTQPCPSLEGCYDYNTMLAFYSELIDLVDGFAQASYMDLPPPSYWFVYGGGEQPTACGEVADGRAFFYCRLDSTVYVGQDLLYESYELAGDGASAFAVAHEWGHHVQHEAGVFSYVTDLGGRVQAENQADCIGGAFLGHLRDQGFLEADDYEDVNTVLPMIASAEGPDRDHGTLAERNAAAQYGHDHGLAACSEFFPGAPLVT